MKNKSHRPQILVTRKLPDAAEAAFAEAFACTFNPADIAMTPEQLLHQANGMDALAITSMDKFPASLISALPESVRMIATVSAGYEHIDVSAARSRGLVASNTPEVLTDATSEIALLLILGAARGAWWGVPMVRENRWPSASMVKPLGKDVSGQRLGILGMGRIGQAVAKRAQAFGMILHYHNRKPVGTSDNYGATYHASFDAMLPHCDFLSINCALTPETKHLINARTLALMPPGAIVVNTARGGVIDDEALISALQSGHLAAAGLDVFAGEPNIDPRYRTLENVFLLPHIGSATLRTRTNMALRALDNLKQYFANQSPSDLIT